MDENQRLSVRLMRGDKGLLVSHRLEDHGSEERSTQSNMTKKLPFLRISPVRQIGDGSGKPNHRSFSNWCRSRKFNIPLASGSCSTTVDYDIR